MEGTILKGTHPGTIPVRFGVIWFSDFREEDLNVIFYQNSSNRYKSVERKMSQKNPEYMVFCCFFLHHNIVDSKSPVYNNLNGP